VSTPSILTSDQQWYTLTADAAVDHLTTDSDLGLSKASAQQRLTEYGPNELQRAGQRSALRRLLGQFTNPLIIVLMIAGAVTLLLQHPLDAAVIFGVVAINAAIGFVQEGRAASALAAVRQMIPSRATVVREGERLIVDSADLVPGDVVLLEAGARVPADMRLLTVRSLRIDEAPLTGESVPVGKHEDAVKASAMLADRDCMAYSGTQVTGGSGRGMVVATGTNTEIGEIGALVEDTSALSTPLIRRMDTLARQITAFILALGALMFAVVVLLRGMEPVEAFLAVVAMAVAGIPEGLPAVITIILAIASRTLARSNAIVRRLPAVETLGSVSVICSDKTGTMTRNEMTVVRLVLPEDTLVVTGSGYAPEGGLHNAEGDAVSPAGRADVQLLAQAAVLCSDAELTQRDDVWQVVGDPTEGALVAFGEKVGVDSRSLRGDFPRVDEVPFESHNRYMATLHHDHHGQAFVLVKGAPETIYAMADAPSPRWLEAAHEAAASGERVLAFARAEVPATTSTMDEDLLPENLRIIGLTGMQDPPRPDTREAIAECHAAGVTVKMITGDHRRTAESIARELALKIGNGALEGSAIDDLDDEELAAILADTDVIARASPAHKLRIVRLLQQQGKFVAMTGDGANDAPALKAADIGVAMGRRGTDAARDSSELVLADDDFGTIRDAVSEGRKVYDNIKKTLLFMLPTSGGQALLVLFALLMGMTMPVTVTQILWVNMVTAVTLALALAFEPAEPGLMRQPPRRHGEPLLTRQLMLRIGFVSFLMLAVALVAFEAELSRGSSIEVARTAAATVLVLSEAVYLFNIRHFTGSSMNVETLIGNRVALSVTGLLIAMQLAFIYAGPMQVLFESAGLGLVSWSIILLLTAAKFFAVEVEKAAWRHAGITRF
jgi:magnesium-transporting ATPase (P-type)